MDASLKWYATRAKPHGFQRTKTKDGKDGEFKAVQELLDLGMSAFVPTEMRVRVVSRHAKRKELRAYPMMQYIMTGTQKPEKLWSDDLRHVAGPVMFNGQPARVRAWEVDRMRSLKDVPTSIPSGRSFRLGDPVVIIDGPMRGQVGKVEKITGGKAVIPTALGNAKVPLGMLERA